MKSGRICSWTARRVAVVTLHMCAALPVTTDWYGGGRAKLNRMPQRIVCNERMCRRSEQRRPGLHACDRSGPAVGRDGVDYGEVTTSTCAYLTSLDLPTCLTLQPGAAPLLLPPKVPDRHILTPSIYHFPSAGTDCIDCLISVPLSLCPSVSLSPPSSTSSPSPPPQTRPAALLLPVA